MKQIIDTIKKMDNLYPISAWITFGIMMLVFIIAQVLTFMTILQDLEKPEEMMEVRELVKLEFRPQIQRIIPQKIAVQPKNIIINKSSVAKTPTNHNNQQQAETSIKLASLVQGFDLKKLLSSEPSPAKRGGSRGSSQAAPGVSAGANRQNKAVPGFGLTGVFEDRNTAFSAGSRSLTGVSSGPKVGVGGTGYFGSGSGSGHGTGSGSGIGSGVGSGFDGTALSGRGTSRSIRGNGSGGGGASISLPSGSGGTTASLDLHALIKWMKAHPGMIPKLVAYDMGHQNADLSSAIPFAMGWKKFYAVPFL